MTTLSWFLSTPLLPYLHSQPQIHMIDSASNSLKPAVAVVGGNERWELGGHEESVSESLPNNTDQEVVSSSQQNFKLSHPRSVKQEYQSVPLSPSNQEQLSVNPQISEVSEAWFRGYKSGLGVASQVWCLGCHNFGYVVPVIWYNK